MYSYIILSLIAFNPPPVRNEVPKINVKESAEEAYNRRMMMTQQKPIEPPK